MVRRHLGDFMPHVALGTLAVIFIPLAVALLPLWAIGKLVGGWLDKPAASTNDTHSGETL